MSIQLVIVLVMAAAVLSALVSVVALRRQDRNQRAIEALQAAPKQPDFTVNREAAEQPAVQAVEPALNLPNQEATLIRAPSFVGQTVYVETRADKFFLRLRDLENGVYDAVRVIKTARGIVAEKFQMRFMGTLVPHDDMHHGMFVSGGYLRYRKMYGEVELGETLSSIVVRALFTVDRSYRQAS